MHKESHRLGWITGGALLFSSGLYLFSCGVTSEKPVAQEDLPGLVFAARGVDAMGNPLDPVRFAPGGDLMTLVPGTPSGTLRNLTGDLTNGVGDASDPEIFLQTTTSQFRVVFAMRTSSADRWHLYEVAVNPDGSRVSAPVQLTCGSSDEVDPTYLPDGRIVFSSDRPGHLDEYERRKSSVLHILDTSQPRLSGQPSCDAGEVVQISFNQSHDRNPIVLRDGTILFSRWEHLGTVNKFPIFFMEPDGTDLFVKYGSHSGVNSFLDLRELPDGRLTATMMPLSGTFEGGAIGIMNAVAEADDPDTASFQLTAPQAIPTGRTASTVGRYHNSYPVPDGTNRYLVSYSTGKVIADMTDEATGVVTVGEKPHYGIWMLNNEDGTLKPIKLPAEGSGTEYVEPVPLMAVSASYIPTAKPQKVANRQSFGTTGVLAAASVYDSEANRALSNAVLGVTIPRDGNGNIDFAALVGDSSLQVVKEVRVIQAVPSQPGVGVEDMGLTEFERQRVLGYAPVEADGSFRVTVPADTSVTVNVVDAKRRSFKVKENWLQVRPGENRTCNGCHSPRRGQPQRAAQDSIALNRAPSTLTPPAISVLVYNTHIQPIFDANCTSCHSSTTPGGNLDLGGDQSGLGFPISYTLLLDGSMNGSDLVVPGESRQSYLVERIFGEEIRAPRALPASDANNHAGLLTDQQKQTIVEWIDLGAQFSNDTVISNPGRRNLDQTAFETAIQPILQQRCAQCHVAGGSSNFVLTNDPEGDFNAVAARANVTTPANSLLLLKATGTVPMIVNGQPVSPVPLATSDADYITILNWITAAQ
ncbi:MAG: PD40 domain-containing protein [Nitrospirae bacterium]|nr:PD40 domain-containing protein [Nitrospirota bacterium]